jgi:hypothetical protein
MADLIKIEFANSADHVMARGSREGPRQDAVGVTAGSGIKAPETDYVATAELRMKQQCHFSRTDPGLTRMALN